MKKAPISAYKAYANYIDIQAANKRTTETRRVEIAKIFGYAGSQEYRFGEVPENVMRLIRNNIRQGYSKVRHGIVPFLANKACEAFHNPFQLGWVCRGYMWVPCPKSVAQELVDQLRTLSGLIDYLKSDGFELRGPTPHGQHIVMYTRGQWGGNSSVLKEVEKLVRPAMEADQQRRADVIDWLDTKPIARQLFTSQ